MVSGNLVDLMDTLQWNWDDGCVCFFLKGTTMALISGHSYSESQSDHDVHNKMSSPFHGYRLYSSICCAYNLIRYLGRHRDGVKMLWAGALLDEELLYRRITAAYVEMSLQVVHCPSRRKWKYQRGMFEA